MTRELTRLEPHESDLVGQWVSTADGVKGDIVNERIGWLTRDVLEPLATSRSGWETLFRDARDGRLWERSFPQGHMHGGGPLRLTRISEQDAAANYERPWGRAAFERRGAAWAAKAYLSGQMAAKDFLASLPAAPIADDVRELIALVEREPKRRGFFGGTRQEYVKYLARVRRLVDSLIEPRAAD